MENKHGDLLDKVYRLEANMALKNQPNVALDTECKNMDSVKEMKQQGQLSTPENMPQHLEGYLCSQQEDNA